MTVYGASIASRLQHQKEKIASLDRHDLAKN